MDKPLIIYHGNCTDGWTAAWIAARSLGDVELFAGFYGQAPPDVTGRTVWWCPNFLFTTGIPDAEPCPASVVSRRRRTL